MARAFGYIRVSTKEQEIARQLEVIKKKRVHKSRIYVDTVSGKDFKRPAWRRLVRRLRRDDVLYVKSIDRFGRNYEEIIEQWRLLTKSIGVRIVVLDMPLLDTTQFNGIMSTFISDLVLQILSFIAHFERDAIRQRQREGIAAAQARGVRFGRPRRPMTEEFQYALDACLIGGLNIRKAAEQCGVPLSTFKERLRWRRKEIENMDI